MGPFKMIEVGIMASRSRARELAVQILYQHEFSGYSLNQVLSTFWNGAKSDSGTRRFAESLVEGVLEEEDALDLEITAYLKNWTMDRIASLDRIVLRIAFYELIHAPDVPWRVAVDEAVALAKMFSSDKSATFVNGVLHAWSSKNRQGSEATEESQEAEPIVDHENDEIKETPQEPETKEA